MNVDSDSFSPTIISFDGIRTPSSSPHLSDADSDQFLLASDTLFNNNTDENSDGENEHSLNGIDALLVHSHTPVFTTTEELLPTCRRQAPSLRQAATETVRQVQQNSSHLPLQRRHALRRISSDSGTSQGTIAQISSRELSTSSNSTRNGLARYAGRRIVSLTSDEENSVQRVTDQEITVWSHNAPHRQAINSTITISPDSSSSSSDDFDLDNEVQVILTTTSRRSTSAANGATANVSPTRHRGWMQMGYASDGGHQETPASLQIVVNNQQRPNRRQRELRPTARQRQRQIMEDRLIAERLYQQAARSNQNSLLIEVINGPSSNKRPRTAEENIPGPSGLNDEFGGVGNCTICMEEEAVKPVACLYCRQLIGCDKCVKKWFRTNNISHLNRYSPLSMGSSNLNHRSCPLCRIEWEDTPEIAPFPLV